MPYRVPGCIEAVRAALKGFAAGLCAICAERRMKKYTIVGGYFDDEFEKHTRKLFDEFKKGVYKPVILSYVITEPENGASEHVKEDLKTVDYGVSRVQP
jgi:hypothetical protein